MSDFSEGMLILFDMLNAGIFIDNTVWNKLELEEMYSLLWSWRDSVKNG